MIRGVFATIAVTAVLFGGSWLGEWLSSNPVFTFVSTIVFLAGLPAAFYGIYAIFRMAFEQRRN